jgi:hypothetical protein
LKTDFQVVLNYKMSAVLIIISIFQALGVYASFQDGIIPRNPQAAGAGPDACSSVDYAISFCSSAIPGFATADNADLANCFCYSSTVWVPNAFDGAVATCAQYAATALPASAYSDIADLEGLCSSLGPIDGGGSPATVSATTTPDLVPATTTSASDVTPAPASVDIFTNPACSTVGYALSYCNSVSPGFTTMDPSSQAPCLCYSSTVWNPSAFDGAVLTCAEYVSSVAPSSLSDITFLDGFCTSVGNVLGEGGGATNTPKQTSKAGATIQTPVATTIQEAPTSTSTNQSLGASSMQNGIWGFGLFVVAVSMIILA